MGGRSKKSSSTFSLFGFLKSGKSAARQDHNRDYYDYSIKAYKVYPSDEDRGRWVADPAIDRKASAYISCTRKKLCVDDVN